MLISQTSVLYENLTRIRYYTHTRTLAHTKQGLLRKKRQIQNLRVQHNLEKQLKVAQSSLRELDDRLDVVQKKGDEFNSNKAKLTDAISNIKEHLTVLQKDPSVNYTSPVKTKYDIASVDTRGAGAAHGLPPMPPGAPPPPPPGAPPPGPPPGPPPPPVALELHGMADLI